MAWIMQQYTTPFLPTGVEMELTLCLRTVGSEVKCSKALIFTLQLYRQKRFQNLQVNPISTTWAGGYGVENEAVFTLRAAVPAL